MNEHLFKLHGTNVSPTLLPAVTDRGVRDIVVPCHDRFREEVLRTVTYYKVEINASLPLFVWSAVTLGWCVSKIELSIVVSYDTH